MKTSTNRSAAGRTEESFGNEWRAVQDLSALRAARERQNLSVSNVAVHQQLENFPRNPSDKSHVPYAPPSSASSTIPPSPFAGSPLGDAEPLPLSRPAILPAAFFHPSLAERSRDTIGAHSKRSEASRIVGVSCIAGSRVPLRATFAPEVGIYICFHRRQTDAGSARGVGGGST